MLDYLNFTRILIMLAHTQTHTHTLLYIRKVLKIKLPSYARGLVASLYIYIYI